MSQLVSILTGPTLGERLKQTKFRPSGFDYLRILLAVAVALWHIPQNSYGDNGLAMEGDSSFTSIFSRFLLTSFFALSGFLVAGSLERCRTISAFAGLRMIRIFPALAVEVTLSALIMGPLLSGLTPKAYVIDPEFRRYFLNLVGEIHFVLPGVFGHNPEPRLVNAQLWTIPYELICYISLTLLVVFGLRRSRSVAPVFTLAIMVAFVFVLGTYYHWQPEYFGIKGTGSRSGMYLVFSFLCGITFYLYRDRVKINIITIIFAIALIIISNVVRGPSTILFPLASAYLTIAIGLTNPRRIWILQGADYSYGIYLYHYVIFQVVAQFVPYNWYAVAGLGLPLVVLFAALSWHLIEKPAMQLRVPLMAGDKQPGHGSALMISAATACLIMGFVLSYKLYPLLNPERSHTLVSVGEFLDSAELETSKPMQTLTR
jgi:flagellin-like protein